MQNWLSRTSIRTRLSSVWLLVVKKTNRHIKQFQIKNRGVEINEMYPKLRKDSFDHSSFCKHTRFFEFFRQILNILIFILIMIIILRIFDPIFLDFWLVCQHSDHISKFVWFIPTTSNSHQINPTVNIGFE